MQDFTGKYAVVTGGGTGIGRELVRQLASEGCNVAMCDISGPNMAETLALIEQDGPPSNTRVTAHVADVSDEAQLIRFRHEFQAQHGVDRLHLLFNNAGIGAIISFIADPREEWERTFNICWGGVYLGCRTFLPLLMAADAGHIVNTSSVNGFWACAGPDQSHTAYSAAKFAVKGFTESLVTDLRLHAPHIKCSVVMPGHIGTPITANARKIISGRDNAALDAEELARAREQMAHMGANVTELSDEAIQQLADEQARRFVDEAPTSAAEAARIILEGVNAGRWRILVGEDAHVFDRVVRADPETAYEPIFLEKVAAETDLAWR
ncbi:MAG: SDR family NAD(P)-dependent oxidoreductase [Novosphingobium sp.]